MSISSGGRGAAVRRVLAFAIAASLLSGLSARAAGQSGSLTFGVTDGRKVITRDLGRRAAAGIVHRLSLKRAAYLQ